MSEDTEIQDVSIEISGEDVVNPVLDQDKSTTNLNGSSKHNRFSVFEKKDLEDPFVQQNGYSWDFILVVDYDETLATEEIDLKDFGYHVEKGTMGNVFEHLHKRNLQELVTRILNTGLDVGTQMARDKKHMIVKIRASHARLEQHASAIGYKLMLDPDKLKLFETHTENVKDGDGNEEEVVSFKYGEEAEEIVKTMTTHYGSHEISWNEIPNDKFTLCPIIDQLFTYNIFTYDFIFYQYDSSFQSLYKCIDGRNFPWRSADRIKLIESILRYRSDEDLMYEAYTLPNGKYNPNGGKLVNDYKEKLEAEQLETSGCSFALRTMKSYKAFEYYTEVVVDVHGKRHVQEMSPVCCIKAYFPIHNEEIKQNLWDKWIASSLFYIPFELQCEIREYFGEKVGLYFTFLNHYVLALIIPAFFGIIAYALVAHHQTWENGFIAFYAICITLWGIIYLELWKRREKFTALRWGMVGFEEEEQNRPEYDDAVEEKPLTPSPITGEMEQIISPLDIEIAMAVSITVVTCFIGVVVGCVTGILLLRYDNNQATAASFLNAIQIQIFDYLYSELAVWLTNRECPRTDTRYEDSLIAKLFIFKFINSFSSMAFLAFAIPNDKIYNSDTYVKNTGSQLSVYCQDGIPQDIGATYTQNRYNCFALLQMRSLEYNLLIIYLTGMFVGNATEVLIPWLQAQYKVYAEKKAREDKIANGETVEPEIECVLSDQFEMEVYDEIMGTLQDYAELAVQYGYTTLFVIAFPLTPLLALISAILEIKVDGGKLLLNYQRPVAKSAEDIGTWQTVYLIITILSVLSNLAIMAFRTPILQKNSNIPPVWGFVISQYVIFICMYIMMQVVPDTPLDVEKQLDRSEYIIGQLKGLEEDEATDLRKDIPQKVKASIGKAHEVKLNSILGLVENVEL